MAPPFAFNQHRKLPARFAEGRIGFAVGDIHGRADLLVRMIRKLEQQAERADASQSGSDAPPIVLYLGDYIDRGPASFEVLEALLSDRPAGFEKRFLKGNHEQAMLAFLENPLRGRAWLTHGGLETLASYGVHPLPPLGASPAQLEQAARALSELLPPTHRDFLDSLERYVVLGDYAFVHAGMDPSRPIEQQSDADLFWIRDRFLNDKRRGAQVVVHGHTPEQAPYRDDRRIGLDTGAYFTGILTAARFQHEEVTFLTVQAS
jgi:diadenosine tetraphosphatase ApaH/serine/threonine PP2A family protein phosphatase